MDINSQAYIAGVFEHPTRKSPDKSCALLHAECAAGALKDAGLTVEDVDGFFCGGDAPGLGPLMLADYIGIKPRHIDSTDIGGSAPLLHIAHAAQAIATGKCKVALITLAGVPRSQPKIHSLGVHRGANSPEQEFEAPYAISNLASYAMVAQRHMYEFGTTSEQLAWIKVATSQHARHNINAVLRDPVSVEDVINSKMLATPLHKLDCCIVSDGGGALVIVSPEIARSLKRPLIKLRGAGEAIKGTGNGTVDLTYSAAAQAGERAFQEAKVRPADIQYASIYDSFTITALIQLEDLGFCKKGDGGKFVTDGKLISGVGKLPINTDGGGLCNNHPSNRGGMTKAIEAVRQLRGEAHPCVQVANCSLALASGIGGNLGGRHGAAVIILERE
jgi:acetyl-CoA C-acetyltransferase